MATLWLVTDPWAGRQDRVYSVSLMHHPARAGKLSSRVGGPYRLRDTYLIMFIVTRKTEVLQVSLFWLQLTQVVEGRDELKPSFVRFSQPCSDHGRGGETLLSGKVLRLLPRLTSSSPGWGQASVRLDPPHTRVVC